MLSNRTIGNGSLALGSVLFALAVAKFLADKSAREPCNRFCFGHDLLVHFFGVQVANVASGALWLLIAALFISLGIRMRRSDG